MLELSCCGRVQTRSVFSLVLDTEHLKPLRFPEWWESLVIHNPPFFYDPFWSYLFMLRKVTQGRALQKPCDETGHKKDQVMRRLQLLFTPNDLPGRGGLEIEPHKNFWNNEPQSFWAGEHKAVRGGWCAWRGAEAVGTPTHIPCPVHLFHLTLFHLAIPL